MTTLAVLAATALAVLAAGAAVRTAVVGGARTVSRTARDTRPVRRHRRRERAPTETVMAEWCEHLARNVRAGSSLRRAMDEAGRAVPDAGSALAPVAAALDRGRALPQALAQSSDDPSTATGLVVSVLGACADLGGPAGPSLDRTAAILHARAAEREERITASAQARLSARVLTVLPFGTLTLLAAAEPSTRAALGTRAGTACLVLGGFANLAGWGWMRRLIRRAT